MTRRPPTVEPDSGLPLVHLSLCSRRGASIDPPGKEGATRLLFKLLKRSARGMGPDEVDERLDAMGGTLAGEVSRSTAALHGACISRSCGAFLDLLHSLFDDPDFRQQRFYKLVQEAKAAWLESLDDDATLARRFFVRKFFEGHPYGRLVGGTLSSLERLELTDLEGLYRQLFDPAELILAMAGDVDSETVIRTERAIFSNLQRTETSSELMPAPAGPKGRHLTFVDKPERSQTQILIGTLGTHPRDDDHTALFVGHTIFGGTFSGRLSQEVRGKRGWSYGAYSDLPLDRQRQAFTLWTFPQSSDAAACIELELRMLQQLVHEGVTREEVEAAKNYLTCSHVFSVDTAAKRADLAVDEFTYDLPPGYYSRYLDRISSVTAQDVNRALQKRISLEDLAITIVGTHEEIGRSIEDCIPNLETATVVPFDQPD